MTNETVIAILSRLKECYLGIVVNALDFAIEAVKAQEPVEPKWRKGYAYCGQCGYKLHWIVDRNNFCPNCGRAVKWE